MSGQEQTLMNAIHVTAIGGPDVLEPVKIPKPVVGAQDALVQITLASINQNDVMERTDYYRHEGEPIRETPFILGAEGIGTVLEVGNNVTEVKPGDRVGFVMHRAQSYAEFAALPADRLIPIPDDLSDEVAASVLVSGLSAQILLSAYKSIGEGNTVLVTAGTSALGSLLVQWASHLGARVIATVRSSQKADIVRGYGAAAAINTTEEDLVQAVRQLTNDQGVDLALDAVGGDLFPQVFESLGTGGIVVPYGIVGGKQPPLDVLALVDRSRQVAGFMLFDYLRSRSELLERIHQVFDAVTAGIIQPQVAETFPLIEAAQAHRHLENSRRVGKILLQPGPV